MLVGPATTAEPCQLLIPFVAPLPPGSSRAAIVTRVPDGTSGRKEVEQKMWGKIPVLGWDLGGSGGEVMPWVHSELLPVEHNLFSFQV